MGKYLDDIGHRHCPNPDCRHWLAERALQCSACGWRECAGCRLLQFKPDGAATVCPACCREILEEVDCVR